MKINYFKIIIPIVVTLLTIGGSLLSHASEKEVTTYITGYVSTFGHPPCYINVNCTTFGSSYCTATVGGLTYQAFGKLSPWDTVCSIILYRNY